MLEISSLLEEEYASQIYVEVPINDFIRNGVVSSVPCHLPLSEGTLESPSSTYWSLAEHETRMDGV